MNEGGYTMDDVCADSFYYGMRVAAEICRVHPSLYVRGAMQTGEGIPDVVVHKNRAEMCDELNHLLKHLAKGAMQNETPVSEFLEAYIRTEPSFLKTHDPDETSFYEEDE